MKEVAIRMSLYVPVDEKEQSGMKTAEEVEDIIPELEAFLRERGYDYQIYDGEVRTP